MDRFTEEDRIEQMAAEKRSGKKIEHLRAVGKILEERRRAREAAAAAEMQEWLGQQDVQEANRRIIEEERWHLLRKRAIERTGTLPAVRDFSH